MYQLKFKIKKKLYWMLCHPLEKFSVILGDKKNQNLSFETLKTNFLTCSCKKKMKNKLETSTQYFNFKPLSNKLKNLKLN